MNEAVLDSCKEYSAPENPSKTAKYDKKSVKQRNNIVRNLQIHKKSLTLQSQTKKRDFGITPTHRKHTHISGTCI